MTMARKLFISFLGAGFYKECTYFDSTRPYKRTRYIQEATLEQIGVKSWAQTDAVRFFITDKAKEENWDKDNEMRYNKKLNKDVPYTRLGKIIENLHLNVDLKPVFDVPVGNNEDEMWKIFQMVFDEIHEGDELYIDLTHAFRYLPMLVLVLSNYAKFLKNIKIVHLSYGNYEAHDDKDFAPIVDLLPLTKLQDWTSAASEYLNHGYAAKLKDNIMDTLRPLLKSSDTRTDNVTNVREFASSLSTFAAERLMCRGLDIENGTAEKTLSDVISRIENTGIAPLNPIFHKISKSINKYNSSIDYCINAAKWCADRSLYQQAATLLREGIVSYFCKKHSDLFRMDNKDDRTVVSNAFQISKDNKPEDTWKVEEKDKPKVKVLLQDKQFANKDLVAKFISLRDLRNDYNHAGFRENATSSKKLVSKIKNAIDTFTTLLSAETTAPAKEVKQRVFLNVSNHPSSGWGDEQPSAAKAYGEVEDFPFPVVSATASSEEINALAESIANDIIDGYPDTELTVHVMGEMTFTFALVSRLKSHGIRCVASCTDRLAENLGNGDKLSHFHFAQFREY